MDHFRSDAVRHNETSKKKFVTEFIDVSGRPCAGGICVLAGILVAVDALHELAKKIFWGLRKRRRFYWKKLLCSNVWNTCVSVGV